MRQLAFVLGIVMYACAAIVTAGAAQDKPVRPKAAVSAAAAVNLNTATSAQLETLPGIGAATAKRIIEHRQKTGGFKKIEELMNVRGIGEKSFLKLKPLVTVATGKSERPADKQ